MRNFYQNGQNVAFTKLGFDPSGFKYLAMKHGPEGAGFFRPISGLWGGPGMDLTKEEKQLLQQMAQAAPEEGDLHAALAQTIEAYPQRSVSSQGMTTKDIIEDLKRHLGT